MTFAQAPAEEPEEEPLITVVYTVGSLKTPIQKIYYPTLPTGASYKNEEMDVLMGNPYAGGVGGMMSGMGGMGGMMSGMGGGMMGGSGNAAGGTPESKDKAAKSGSVPPANPIQTSLDMDELIDIITKTIKPTTWDSVGGPGSIQPYKNQDLVISQTLAVHKEIRNLLKEINVGRGTGDLGMAIEAYWLLLDSAQLEKLRLPSSGDGKKVRITVDPKILEEFSRTVPSLRGQIACLNNQSVHLVAGDRRNVLTSAIPVVGGSEAGYQPVSANINVGALLQVCPAYIPGMNSATVDLESTVTNWRDGLDPVKIETTMPPSDIPTENVPGMPSTKHPGKTSTVTLMDHLKIPAHQIACTLKVPLGKPVLVGGLTLDPTKFETTEEKKITERKQLYLILRVSECEDE
jgi:hypothetical protein